MSKREKAWLLIVVNGAMAVILLAGGWFACVVSEVSVGMVLAVNGVPPQGVVGMFSLWDRLPVIAGLWALSALITFPFIWCEIGAIRPPPPPPPWSSSDAS